MCLRMEGLTRPSEQPASVRPFATPAGPVTARATPSTPAAGGRRRPRRRRANGATADRRHPRAQDRATRCRNTAASGTATLVRDPFRTPIRGHRQTVGHPATCGHDQRRVGTGAGDSEHVPHESVSLMTTEGLGLQPLDGPDEMHLPGHRLAVCADKVDLGVVLPVPPAAMASVSGHSSSGRRRSNDSRISGPTARPRQVIQDHSMQCSAKSPRPRSMSGIARCRNAGQNRRYGSAIRQRLFLPSGLTDRGEISRQNPPGPQGGQQRGKRAGRQLRRCHRLGAAIALDVRSPLPTDSSTARERDASGNSPKRDGSPATTRRRGIWRRTRRKSIRLVPGRHDCTISGNPPVIS